MENRIYVDGSTRQTCTVVGDVAVVLPVGKVGERVSTNQAEYIAVIEGLKRAHRLGWQEVEVLPDSQLAVRQINTNLGLPTDIKYHIKNKELQRLMDEVEVWVGKFVAVQFSWLPRGENLAGEVLG